MDRRTILKYTALASGAAVSAPLLGIILSGCAREQSPADDYQPLFFSGSEMAQLRTIMDVMLPETDSPSATAVGVHQIMDAMIGQVYTLERQAIFKDGFTSLLGHLSKVGFFDAQTDAQVKALQALETSDDEQLHTTYTDVKQQTIAYYLSNETIGEQFLNYLPVPGAYEPCITVEAAGGKLWAL